MSYGAERRTQSTPLFYTTGSLPNTGTIGPGRDCGCVPCAGPDRPSGSLQGAQPCGGESASFALMLSARVSYACAFCAIRGILQVYESGEANGRLFIAMELVEGGHFGGVPDARKVDWGSCSHRYCPSGC